MSKNLDAALIALYGSGNLSKQRQRWQALIKGFRAEFGGEGPVHLFSCPGRTEIGGNHTDHNNGLVLTAAINLDIVAAARPRQDTNVHIISDTCDKPFHISLDSLEPHKDEYESSPALVRGVAAYLKKLGCHIYGFDAFITSELPAGKGMSSSAAFEVLIGHIWSSLFNAGALDPLQLAQTAQKAESKYFGKPCGLMDQLACTYGGLLSIDFEYPLKPRIANLETPSFEKQGLKLFFLDDDGDHSGLSAQYAAISEEMRAVAGRLGKVVLREIEFKAIRTNMASLRSELGDRAVMRALHYFQENERVRRQMAALLGQDIDLFLRLVQESGRSSWMLLQNCIDAQTPRNQAMGLVWALTDFFLQNEGKHARGACRVHGGGFGGAVQVYIDERTTDAYQKFIEECLGNQLLPVSIRRHGVHHLVSIPE